MIGQSYSTSQNACMLTLVGGPYDGESGLFDHNQYDSIQFCNSEKRVTYIYKLYLGREYIFDREFKWGR